MYPVPCRLLATSYFVFAGLLLAPGAVVAAQGVSAQPVPAASLANATPSQLAMTDALNAMQPTLTQVNAAVSAVDVHRWKTPNDVRDTTTSDVQSIQRDLVSTLPGLLNQAQSSPAAIAPAFAVFRNIDALYDVLLRITETATLAGTQAEAGRLEGVRADLQARRAQLGTAILMSATAQDNNVVQLRTSLMNAPKAAVTPVTPKKVVVDDGPTAAVARTVRKKKPAAAKPAADNTASPPAAAPQQ